MLIRERTSGAVTILDLKATKNWEPGEASVKDVVQRLVQEGRRRVVLNLESVPSLDSTGLGVLVSAYVTASRQGGRYG